MGQRKTNSDLHNRFILTHMECGALKQKMAVRAFRRVWEPIGESMAEAEAADAGFDGGEWSGPAHSCMQQEEYHKLLARVGARFGYSESFLGNLVLDAEYHEMNRLLDAHHVPHDRGY